MFEYRIYKNVYDEILSGDKTIEFRLLNEKSKKIKPGDTIKFTVVDDDSLSIFVTVVEKIIFNDINELWEHKKIVNNNVLDYTQDEFINVFYNIFGKDKVDSSKIVGIKFNIIH